jgi:hypothetical protein
VGGDGTLLAQLFPANHATGGATGQIATYAADGTPRAVISNGANTVVDGGTDLDPASTDIRTTYPNGNPMVRMGTLNLRGLTTVGVQGAPAFALYDDALHIRFLATLDAGGNGAIYLLDATGKVTWSAP